jgi:UDP-N-acetylmuramate--alanine ligase
VQAVASLDELARQVALHSQPGDLLLAMGAGDVNGLWDRLQRLPREGQAVVESVRAA